MEDRKGVLTKEQEQILDDLIKLRGIPEALDGVVIRIIDDKAIERLIAPLKSETKQLVYEVIDTIFEGLKALTDG